MNLKAALSWVRRNVISWSSSYRWLAAATGLVLGILIGLVVFREIWRLQPDLGDLPTWILVAIGLVGGVIGLLQFRTFLREQGAVAKRNEKRDELMDSQLAEAKRRMDADLRRQAEDVELAWVQRPMGGEVVSTAIVTNKSRRPITRVTSRVVAKADGSILKVPDAYGFLPYGGDKDSDTRDAMTSRESGQEFVLLRRTLSCGFRFSDIPIDPDRHIFVAWFRDDADIPWQLDDGGHLVQADDGDVIVYRQ